MLGFNEKPDYGHVRVLFDDSDTSILFKYLHSCSSPRGELGSTFFFTQEKILLL